MWRARIFARAARRAPLFAWTSLQDRTPPVGRDQDFRAAKASPGHSASYVGTPQAAASNRARSRIAGSAHVGQSHVLVKSCAHECTCSDGGNRDVGEIVGHRFMGLGGGGAVYNESSRRATLRLQQPFQAGCGRRTRSEYRAANAALLNGAWISGSPDHRASLHSGCRAHAVGATGPPGRRDKVVGGDSRVRYLIAASSFASVTLSMSYKATGPRRCGGPNCRRQRPPAHRSRR